MTPSPGERPLDRRDPAWTHQPTRARNAGRRQPAGVPELPETITQACPWPAPLALLIAAEPYPVAVDALRRVGFAISTIDPTEPTDRLTELDGLSYVLLGHEVLNRSSVVELLEAIRVTSPVVRFLLLAGPSATASTLLAAIRVGAQEVLDPLDQIALLSGLRAQVDRAARSRARILAIGAHPDDVELGCGGTLLEHRRRGDRISLLTLSRGSVGGIADDRSAEAGDAASLLGAQLLLADLPDTRIDDGADTIAIIEQAVAVLDPTMIYVHSSHDTHQDHRAVHAATLSAARTVPTLLAYQAPSAVNRFQPTSFVPIDGVLRRKLEVLACYASQASRSYMEPGTVDSIARYWGRHAGPRVVYAEPFEVLRSLDWRSSALS